jgi:hypothetical protein
MQVYFEINNNAYDGGHVRRQNAGDSTRPQG